MVSILYGTSLVSCTKHVSCDKYVFKNSWEPSRLQYGVITSVTNTVDIHHTGGEIEKETVTSSARTHIYTYKSITIETFQKKGSSISSFEARELEKHKNTALIAQKARTKQPGSYSHNFHFHHKPHFVDSDSKENKSAIVISSTQDRNDNKNIIINNDEDNMVYFSFMNDDRWWNSEEPRGDEDDEDLSPQMVLTTTDLAMAKNIDIPSNLQGLNELFPKPDKTVGAGERRDEKEGNSSFSMENALAFLEHMNEIREDEAIFFVSDIDTKVSSEYHYAPSDCSHECYDIDDGQVDEDDSEEDDDEDDNSSIESSSSSAVYEHYDDMSMLTDEDSFGFDDDEDSDDSYVIPQTFEDISLFSKDIWEREGKDGHTMIVSWEQGYLFEEHHNEECQHQMNNFVIKGEKNVREASMDHVPLDFLVGFYYQAGFSPKDELRLA